MSTSNPCLQCGACCAFYRVSFHWAESSQENICGVPEDLTEPFQIHQRAMRGTNHANPKCVALSGKVREQVRCTIFELRPSPCRSFEASFSKGLPNERCDRARAAYGLPPLSPADWKDQERPPEGTPSFPRAA